MEVAMKKIILPIAIAACALAAQFAPAAPPPDVKEIMSKPLTDILGKEGLVLTVTYPPGGADQIHRHDAHAFVYVLEGSIVMQLRGAEPVTLKAGEGFYEGPNDVHLVGCQHRHWRGTGASARWRSGGRRCRECALVGGQRGPGVFRDIRSQPARQRSCRGRRPSCGVVGCRHRPPAREWLLPREDGPGKTN